MTICERLFELLGEQRGKQEQLAAFLGVGPTTITTWKRRNTDPPAKLIVQICEFLGCSTDYLLTGRDEETAPIHNISGISEDAQKVGSMWERLDESGRAIILGEIYRRRELMTAPKEVKIRYVVPAFQFSLEPPLEPVRYKTSRYAQPMSAGTGIEAGDDGPEDFMLVKQPPRGTSYVAPVSGNSMEPTFHDGDELFVHACSDINPGQIGVFLMDGRQWVKELGDGVLVSHNSEYDPIPITEDVRCQGLVLGVCDASYLDLRQTQ